MSDPHVSGVDRFGERSPDRDLARDRSRWLGPPWVPGIGAVTHRLKNGSATAIKGARAVPDKGQAGLIVLYATTIADQIAASIKVENGYVSKCDPSRPP